MPTVDGIVSGLDTTSLIKAMVSPQQVSVDTLNSRVTAFQKQRTAVAGIKSKFTALSDAIKKMNTSDLFNASKVTSTSDQFSVTADTTALAGSYDIQVSQLAKGQISKSLTFADPDAAVLGTGTFSVTVAGTTTNITLDNTNNNFQELADALDAVDGLSAYVLDTGAAGASRYTLVVQGETGDDNAFTFDETAVTGGTATAGFTDTQTAVDAHLVVAGVTVFLSTNTATDVIPGLTLSLLSVGATADTVVVERDTTSMKAKIQAVVDAYNAILDDYDLQTVFNPDAGIKGPLVGETTTRRAIADIGSQLSGSYAVTGVDYRSLAELGIETLQTGELTFDEAAFDEVYEADPDGVTLYLTDASGPLNSVVDSIDTLYVDTTSGVLTSRDATLEGIIEDLEEQITRAQARITTMSDLLRSRFTAMESTLSRIQSTGNMINALFFSNSNG